MLNYMRSECYRTFRRKYLYAFSGTCALIVLGSTLLSFFGNRQTADAGSWLHMEAMLDMLALFLPTLGLYAVLLTMDLAFSGEYKSLTLKNTVSFGVPRATVYFGKLLTAVLYSVIVLAVVLLSFFGFGILFLGIGAAAYFQEVVRELGWGLLGAFPLWVAALSLANLLMFAIRSGTGASFAYMGLMLLTGTVLDLLDLLGYSVFGVMKGWLISTQLGNLYGTVGHWDQIAAAWGSGFVYTAVFCLIGYGIFRRMEIK